VAVRADEQYEGVEITVQGDIIDRVSKPLNVCSTTVSKLHT